MKTNSYHEAVSEKQKIGIWGMSDYLYNVIDKIDPDLTICGICDQNPEKHGIKICYGAVEFCCISPEELLAQGVQMIMVATRSMNVVREIEERVADACIGICHIREAISAYKEEWEKRSIEKYDVAMGNVTEPEETGKVKCFINLTVPISFCNLQCSYCYVGQHKDFYEKKPVLYSTEFIRRALSRKRIGGSALLNFCGSGETFLCRQLVDIIEALLDEGHYISIITNALIEEPVKRLLSHRRSDRLFFKCSFHYMELKEKGLLEKYSGVVKLIQESPASFSVEIVPHDELIPCIDEMKEFCLAHFGALPHVTVARDEETDGEPILTKMSMEDYRKIWGMFDSELFAVKMRHQTKEQKACIAGQGTFIMDLEHGGRIFCPNNGRLDNIYSDISTPITYKSIGHGCHSCYCINSHAYLTLGMIPEVKESTYYDVRNRQCADGSNWVKSTLQKIMGQRICENIEEI